MPIREATSGVMSTLTSPAISSRPNSVVIPRLPDQVGLDRGACLDRLERVHLHVRRQHRLRTDRALVADGDALVDDGVGAHVDALAQDRALHPCALADVAAGVDHAAADLGAILDDRVVAEHRVGADAGAVLDLAVVADVGWAVDLAQFGQLHALAQIDVLTQPDAGNVECDVAVQRVEVGLPVLVEVADVLPVAVEHVPVQRLAARQQVGERCFEKS